MSLVLLWLSCLLAMCSAQYGCELDPFYGTCSLDCWNLGWDDGIHPGHEAGRIASSMIFKCQEQTTEFVLNFYNCSFPNQSIESDWFTNSSTPKFTHLSIDETDVKYIEDGAIAQYRGFNKTLTNLFFRMVPSLTKLTHGMFEDIFNLNSTFFKVWGSGLIETVDVSVVSTNFTGIVFGDLGFRDIQSIANLTGKCQPTRLNKIEELSYIYLSEGHEIPVFGRDLVSALTSSELIEVNLYNAGIEYIEDNLAFQPFAARPNKLKIINMFDNKIKTIPNGLFKPLYALDHQVNLTFSGNNFHCDGDLKYFQDVLKDETDNLIFSSDVICSSPPSLRNIEIIYADLSGDYEPLPPSPKLEISCN